MVVIELSTAAAVEQHWKAHLSFGGAYGPAGGTQRAVVSLLVVGPAAQPLELTAKTVHCGADGTGYELQGFNAAMRAQIEAWVAANTAEDALDHAKTTRMPRLRRSRTAPPAVAAPAPRAAAAADVDPGERIARNVFERIRALSAVEQVKLARDGELDERVALERLVGKPVWEALLRNPRITPREVARIARMGTLPGPLLDNIVTHAPWVKSPEVRRALLTNPRLTAGQIGRVLRELPKSELKLVPQQASYPAAVREAAGKLLRKG